jgi:hypothetical protein
MKTINRIFLFSLGAALIGFWPGGADAQVGAPGPCGLGSPGSILGLAPGGVRAPAAMVKRTLKCLQATGQAPAAASAGVGGRFVAFDPPGSTSTSPQGITPDGTITGSYTDASGVPHGFLRTPTGSFTTFDPPGSIFTSVSSISTNGEIAGTYCDTAACAHQSGFVGAHGFVRTRDGNFTTFDSPPGSGGLIPAIYGSLPGINPSGAIVGDFCNPTTCYTSFIRYPNGSFTTIDTPSSVACGGGAPPPGASIRRPRSRG